MGPRLSVVPELTKTHGLHEPHFLLCKWLMVLEVLQELVIQRGPEEIVSEKALGEDVESPALCSNCLAFYLQIHPQVPSPLFV